MRRTSVLPSPAPRRIARRATALLAVAFVAGSVPGAQAGPAAHDAHAAHAATATAGAHHAAAKPAGASVASAGAHGAPHAAGPESMFEVGTPHSPLVTRPGKGPLWPASKVNAVGMTSHGTLAEAVIADRLAAERLAATGPKGLTTAQATRKLSRSCRKVIKARRSTLSKIAKKRRSKCLTQRRKLVRDSRRSTPSVVAPGVTAPAAPVKGPEPTTGPRISIPGAPGAGAPSAPTPAPVPGPAPTPAPGAPAAPAPATPAEPVYAAVGVTATEGGEKFRLTRAFATADIVNFELVNVDSQKHDLWIAPADADGEISGPPTEIIGRIDGQVDGRPTRASTDMVLKPGRYKLICTVAGHGPMAIDFSVFAPGS